MSTGLRGAVQAGWPVIAVGLAVLGLLTLAIAHPGAGAPSRPAASAGNYGPNPPNIRPLAGQDVLTAIALAIVLTLLLALFFARRRGRNGIGNGNGHGNGNGQEGEVATAGVLAGGPSLGPPAEESGADLDQTLSELDALIPPVAETPEFVPPAGEPWNEEEESEEATPEPVSPSGSLVPTPGTRPLSGPDWSEDEGPTPVEPEAAPPVPSAMNGQLDGLHEEMAKSLSEAPPEATEQALQRSTQDLPVAPVPPSAAASPPAETPKNPKKPRKTSGRPK